MRFPFVRQPERHWICTGSEMPREPFDRPQKFRVGDDVIVVNPGVDRGKRGIVVQVSGHPGDFVYRYNVRFADGTSKKFFGFEIDSVLWQSA